MSNGIGKVTTFNSLSEIGTPVRLDSNEGIFFERELEVIREQVFEEGKPMLNFLEVLPVKSDLPDWAAEYTYRWSNESGKAGYIGNGADDFPVVGVGMSEASERVRMIGAAVEFTAMDLQRAMISGLSLEQSLFRTARRAIETKINEIAWYGDASQRLRGLLRHPEIMVQPVSNAIGGSASADNVLAELNACVNDMLNNTEQVEAPTDLLLPPDSYQYAAQQQRSTASDTSTLNFWLATNGYVGPGRAHSIRELRNATIPASGGGTTTSDVIVALRRDREVMEFVYSGIKELPIHRKGAMTYVVPFYACTAGLAVYKPRAISIRTGA